MMMQLTVTQVWFHKEKKKKHELIILIRKITG